MGDLDHEDEDMVDAALLATADSSGGILWCPSTLQDIYDIPSRTLRLFFAFRAGQNVAASNAVKVAKHG